MAEKRYASRLETASVIKIVTETVGYSTVLGINSDPYSNFYENVTFLRNLVNFCEFLSKGIMDRNAPA